MKQGDWCWMPTFSNEPYIYCKVMEVYNADVWNRKEKKTSTVVKLQPLENPNNQWIYHWRDIQGYQIKDKKLIETLERDLLLMKSRRSWE